jgi:transposase, IS5 family
VGKRRELKGTTVKCHRAFKHSKIKVMREGALKDLAVAVERTWAQICTRVEHPLHVVKNLFGRRKAAVAVP